MGYGVVFRACGLSCLWSSMHAIACALLAQIGVGVLHTPPLTPCQGECFGLLGVNGAGKSTTFSLLTGGLAVSCCGALLATDSCACAHGLVRSCAAQASRHRRQAHRTCTATTCTATGPRRAATWASARSLTA
jgi:ATPase subunit of ABC transporter with duplicated ATPase domains